MRTFFIVLLVLASLAIIVATQMIEPKSQGAGAMYGQDTNTFGSAAFQTRDKLLNKVTIISAVVFMVSLIGLLAVK